MSARQQQRLAGLGPLLLIPVVAGCQDPECHVVSNLAGSWSVVERHGYEVHSHGGAGRITPTSRCEDPYLIFRPDGSFDWSRTLLKIYGPPDRLQQTGDRLDYADSEQRGYFKVEKARYTPDSSEITMRRQEITPQRACARMTFMAKLLPDGTLVYRASITEASLFSTRRVVETTKLKRSEAAAPPA